MKYLLLLTLALILALPNTVQAALSKGKMVTMCKQHIVQSVGKISRFKIKKIRRKKVMLSVRRPDEDKSQVIVCQFDNKMILLTKADGTAFNNTSISSQ